MACIQFGALYLVVDPGDEEQHGGDDVADLLALLRREERQHGGHDAEANERDAGDGEDEQGSPVVGVGEVELEERRADAEGERRLEDAVDDRVEAHAEQVRNPAGGAHERVLDGPSHRSQLTVSESTSKSIER
jgi:hypothetical protein